MEARFIPGNGNDGPNRPFYVFIPNVTGSVKREHKNVVNTRSTLPAQAAEVGLDLGHKARAWGAQRALRRAAPHSGKRRISLT
jgi:hypothetical protein